ncbi:S8 family peptidase [Sphingomonas sanguinis]|uniref:S8 family peptidase n=1 Tax=Sphingomonas sanguinis TaxID=33051 RepID=UPI001C5A49E7|nr:S8 family peptidase [Sphingomonas sanguinis]QXT34861.1 S8 family peptidase [Sphingomonas sanguinis]
MPLHRHLVVRGLGRASEEFEPVGRGGTDRPSAVSDRVAHAGRLRGDLGRLSEEARALRAEQVALGIPKSKLGVTVTVHSREGERLAVGDTLRANSRGRQLLNVRRFLDVQGARKRDRAVYYLSSNALKSLNKALDGYEEWEQPEEDPDELTDDQTADGAAVRRTRSFWLFESAETFRPAEIEDLWTDPLEHFPRARGAVEWEIWVRSSMREVFETGAAQLRIGITGTATEFVDIAVYNCVATKAALARLVLRSAAVVELRGASNFIADHQDLPPPERLRQIAAISTRVVPAPPAAPWVTLLDTGVNPGSALLSHSLPAARCRAVVGAWDPFDAHGHGSMMAGVALYGDLSDLAATSGRVALETGLESVVVFNPDSVVKLPARDAIARAVALAEGSVRHPRVYCLAATIVGEAEDGRPTSSSGSMDALAFNDGLAGRLFCVAVGNVTTTATAPYQVAAYAKLNEEDGIQSPAQALNVLSVGALTSKCSGPTPLADEGNLSPRSRTAQAWDGRRHKPDIVMEGGNHGIDPGGTTSRAHGPDMIATTSNRIDRITLTGDTSAACAAAARLAARVMARYPALRPETVRGLLVHCAEWTDAMEARRTALVRAGAMPRDAVAATLDCFGWGVPDEERVFWSASNAATLVAEDELLPYEPGSGGSVKLRQMKSFRLPWPDAALRSLAGTEVELRCTLSYFVEPDLHSAGLERRQFYPSHGLRFDMQRYQESEVQAQRRVNRAVAGDSSTADDAGWLLGWQRRNRGTVHQDVWRGPAYQLVGRRLVNVMPVRGWWAAGRRVEKADVPVRFSLITSIRTPTVRGDLMVEMRNAVPAGLLVDVPAVVAV